MHRSVKDAITVMSSAGKHSDSLRPFLVCAPAVPGAFGDGQGSRAGKGLCWGRARGTLRGAWTWRESTCRKTKFSLSFVSSVGYLKCVCEYKCSYLDMCAYVFVCICTHISENPVRSSISKLKAKPADNSWGNHVPEDEASFNFSSSVEIHNLCVVASPVSFKSHVNAFSWKSSARVSERHPVANESGLWEGICRFLWSGLGTAELEAPPPLTAGLQSPWRPVPSSAAA